MGTLTASLIVMRWGLLSALMMFLASTLKIKFKQASHPFASFICSWVGIGMSCCFVTGLIGVDMSAEHWHAFVDTMTNAFTYAIQQSPDVIATTNF